LDVGTWFRAFHNNLYMKNDVVDNVRLKYKNITKRINMEYWNSNSKINNSLFVGSYGRSTEINTSDIDIIVIVPWSVKSRFDKRLGNIQSQLLTEVKEKLSKTYSNSRIKSDGQVIIIDFSDNITFEIVPAFKYNDGSFCYPDTNSGGSWEKMNPTLEKERFNTRNKLDNNTMKKFCRMIRAWREKNNIEISGELIDTIIYRFYADTSSNYLQKNYFVYFDWISRDFFQYLEKNVHRTWITPGTYRKLKIKYPYTTKDKAKEAYKKSIEAISDEKEYPILAKIKWRDVYGEKFQE